MSENNHHCLQIVLRNVRQYTRNSLENSILKHLEDFYDEDYNANNHWQDRPAEKFVETNSQIEFTITTRGSASEIFNFSRFCTIFTTILPLIFSSFSLDFNVCMNNTHCLTTSFKDRARSKTIKKGHYLIAIFICWLSAIPYFTSYTRTYWIPM